MSNEYSLRTHHDFYQELAAKYARQARRDSFFFTATIFLMLIVLIALMIGLGMAIGKKHTSVAANAQGWRITNMNADEIAIFNRAIENGNPTAREYIYSIQDNIVITMYDPYQSSPCGNNTESSCFFSSSRRGKISEIYFNQEHFRSEGFQSEVIWHELGHAIVYYYFDNDTLSNLEQRLEKTHHHSWPIDGDGYEVPTSEIWADLWTMWALDTTDLKSIYNTPAMISKKETAKILHDHID